MKSIIRTGAKLLLKIDDGSGERSIGFCTSISYGVSQGTKTILTVDSPFPVEIASAAGASQVRGTMTIFLLQNMTPESAGLVPFRTSGTASGKDMSPHPGDPTNTIHLAHSKYFHMRLYDRGSGEMFAGMDFTKITNYNVTVSAKGIVTATLNFESKYLVPGQG